MRNTPLSIPAVWSKLYNELKNSPWEDEDVDSAAAGMNPDAHGAALVLRRVYRAAQDWKGVDAEEGVLATLKAARLHYCSTFLTVDQVTAMAEAYNCHYDDFAEPADDYLEDNAGDVRWDWLNDRGRKRVEEAVVKDSEIWLENEPNLSGVWVFNRPGQT